MYLTIVAPCGILCSTTVDKVSLPGEVGSFTVLRGHAPIIAHLTAGEVVYATGGAETRVAIRSGFVRVERDRIDVCVEMQDAQKEPHETNR